MERESTKSICTRYVSRSLSERATTLAARYRGSASICQESTRCTCVRYGRAVDSIHKSEFSDRHDLNFVFLSPCFCALFVALYRLLFRTTGQKRNLCQWEHEPLDPFFAEERSEALLIALASRCTCTPRPRMPRLSFATTLLALLVAFAAPATASSADPDQPYYDNARGSGLPHCECDAWHNGAFHWMSRMCMQPVEEEERVVCYPTRIGHPGTVLAGRYYNNACDGGQSTCSPWTQPTNRDDDDDSSPNCACFWCVTGTSISIYTQRVANVDVHVETAECRVLHSSLILILIVTPRELAEHAT